MIKPNVSAALILDKRSIKKDGTSPVKVRIIFNRTNKKLYSIMHDADDRDFERIMQTAPRDPRIVARKKSINAYLGKAEAIIADLPVFTFEEFELRWYGVRRDKSNVYDAITAYAEDCVSEGKALKTKIGYQTLCNSMRLFKAELTFDELTPDWLKKYEKWLLDNGKVLTTVGFYMRNLRAVCNKAMTDKVMPDSWYPFKKYTPPKGSGRNIGLSKEQIKQINAAVLIDKNNDDKARDFFILSYLCNGMNFKDIVLLKNKDIRGKKMEFIRSKTKRTTQNNLKPIRVSLGKRALEIIEKWKAVREKSTQDDYIFDIITDGQTLEQQKRCIEQFIRNTNEGLKRIAKQIEINEHVTTYTARHSYASNMLRNGAPRAFIQESLGHASMAITEAYLAGFDDTERERWAETLL